MTEGIVNKNAGGYESLSVQNSGFISCTVNNIEANCMIDTGSDVSIIDESFLKATKPPQNSPSPTNINLTGANGFPIEVVGKMCVDVKIGSQLYPVSFMVVRSFRHEMLIGKDFLNRNGVVVDFCNENIHMNGSGEKIPFSSSQVLRVKVTDTCTVDGQFTAQISVNIDQTLPQNTSEIVEG